MNFNNRLSSTLANNIKLDSNVEHEAEKIAGGNIIWLVNRPAGVKIYVNSTPDRTGALVLNEANRGYKWEELGEYGSLKLYDNFYIWTEGTNLNNEKIELQISPNADIITPILGNTADKIDKIDTIENFSQNALIQLNNAINNFFTLQNPIFQTKIMGEYKLGRRNWAGRVAILPNGKDWNISDLNLDDNEYYRVRLFGHFDLGGTNPELDSSESGAVGNSLIKFKLEHTAHLCIFKNDNNANFSAWTYADLGADIEFPAEQFFLIDKEPYANKIGVFDLYGLKYESFFYFQHTDTGNGAWSHDTLHTLQDTGLNINCNDFIIKGSELNSYDKIGILCTSNLSGNNNTQKPNPSLHCSLMMTISKAYSNILG